MNLKVLFLLLLTGCYSVEARMATHFGVQDCSTEQCTTLTQRKWVGIGVACEVCASANSSRCFDGYCDAKVCKAYTTCTKVATGADCDNTKCCDSASSWCDAATNKCLAWQIQGQACGAANQKCNPTTLMCNGTGPSAVCISQKALGVYCTSSFECLDDGATCKGTSANVSDTRCKISVKGGASCDPLKNICGASLDCTSGSCTLKDKGGDCQGDADCKTTDCAATGKCAEIRNIGASCGDDNQVCVWNSQCIGTGTAAVCTGYRSVAKDGLAPNNNVMFCKYGLFVSGSPGKCTDSKTCTKDSECDAYSDYSQNVVCNPTGSTCAGGGKCVALAANCGSLIDSYWATPTEAKDQQSDCCVDAATNQGTTTLKNACKKAAETPTTSKSGASSSFLTTTALLVALVAGFFAL